MRVRDRPAVHRLSCFGNLAPGVVRVLACFICSDRRACAGIKIYDADRDTWPGHTKNKPRHPALCHHRRSDLPLLPGQVTTWLRWPITNRPYAKKVYHTTNNRILGTTFRGRSEVGLMSKVRIRQCPNRFECEGGLLPIAQAYPQTPAPSVELEARALTFKVIILPFTILIILAFPAVVKVIITGGC
jgi:hypothetical protein